MNIYYISLYTYIYKYMLNKLRACQLQAQPLKREPAGCEGSGIWLNLADT